LNFAGNIKQTVMATSTSSLLHLLFSLFILSFTFIQVDSISGAAGNTLKEHEDICRLTKGDGKGGKQNTPCAFPFRFDGKLHNGTCTNKGDPDGLFWCSTKTVGKLRRHRKKGGFWGYCQEGCDKKPGPTLVRIQH
jgi:hypothetical protein